MEAEQWVMIGAEVSWEGFSSDGVIEHPTYGYAIDVRAFDTKTDNAAGEHIHDQQHPLTAQEDRFAAEEWTLQRLSFALTMNVSQDGPLSLASPGR